RGEGPVTVEQMFREGCHGPCLTIDRRWEQGFRASARDGIAGVQKASRKPLMIRPRRSLLFMPGSNARALEKARILPADGIILDIEDSVAPDAKAKAREQ